MPRLEGQGFHVGFRAFDLHTRGQHALGREQAVREIEARIDGGHAMSACGEGGRGPRAPRPHLEHAPRAAAQGVGGQAKPFAQAPGAMPPEGGQRARGGLVGQPGRSREAFVAAHAVLELQKRQQLGSPGFCEKPVYARARGEETPLGLATKAFTQGQQRRCAVGTAPARVCGTLASGLAALFRPHALKRSPVHGAGAEKLGAPRQRSGRTRGPPRPRPEAGVRAGA